MTSSIRSAAPSTDLERVVSDYLREHPEFFDNNVELLRDLAIPHPTGEAVSLVERQLAALRRENQRLKQSFERVVELAKANEALNARVHALALQLMGASGPLEIFDTLRNRLTTGLRADRVSVRVFAEPGFVDAHQAGDFVGRQSVRRGPFAQMLDAAKPLCGRLSKMQSKALFDVDEPSGSAVVLPLRAKRWDGLLGIHSNNPDRFEPDMGTDMLIFLAEVASLLIDPWVASRKRG